jgi:hypothetical protein
VSGVTLMLTLAWPVFGIHAAASSTGSIAGTCASASAFCASLEGQGRPSQTS